MKYNRTEQKVLSAMALSTAVTLADGRRDWPEQPEPKGVLLTYTSICKSVNYASRSGRKVSDRNVSLALDSLVRKGDVVKDAPIMMTPYYKLNPDLTAAADRRYNR